MIKLIFLNICILFSISAHAVESGLEKLKLKNHFALIRHSTAPGNGDPKNFKLGDCKTQRNLSEDGKKEAQHIGNSLRSVLGDVLFVYSSQWCRAQDTAKELSPKFQSEKVLNSFFQNMNYETTFKDEFKKWISLKIKKENPLILFTHQVNITALTNVFPSEGEIVILKYSENNFQLDVVDRIKLKRD